MRVPDNEIESRMQQFKDVCQKAGLKVTNQRIEIFREVAQTEDHPDVETIYKGVSKRMSAVSLDTVYRTLWLFFDIGLISLMGQKKERLRFDANLTPHHHFVCNECGLTRDFYEDSFDHLKVPDQIQQYGNVQSSHIELRGLCHECAQKIK